MKNATQNFNILENLTIIKQRKFDLYEKYKFQLIGFSKALDFLNHFNNLTDDIKVDSTEHSVEYYNSKKKELKNYEYIDFNTKMHNFYNSEYVYRKIIIYNKLYSIINIIYNRICSERNLRYNQDMFNCYDFINHFVRALRLNYVGNLVFDAKSILSNFNIKFFEEEITFKDQNSLLLNLIFGLEDAKVLNYDYNSNCFEFNLEFNTDLMILIYSSLDCLILGKQSLYQIVSTDNNLTEQDLIDLIVEYNKFSVEQKLKADDILFQYIIANTTNFISFQPNINNLFFEFFELKKNLSLTYE